MDWQQSTSGNLYTLQMGTCVASVWQSSDKQWGARVAGQSRPVAIKDFPTLQDAQAWCITGLAALRRSGQCGEEV